MKTLYLIRHGKSSWENPSLRDIDRPLKGRGYRDGRLIGEELLKREIFPDHIISSPAKRAHTTAGIIGKALSYSEEQIEINRSIYFEGTAAILAAIRATDDSISTLFVFGHNPDFTDLASELAHQSFYNVPTTGVVGIRFSDQTWNTVSKSTASLICFLKPKDLRG